MLIQNHAFILVVAFSWYKNKTTTKYLCKKLIRNLHDDRTISKKKFGFSIVEPISNDFNIQKYANLLGEMYVQFNDGTRYRPIFERKKQRL